MKSIILHNRPRVASIILLILVGVNALAAGYSFMTDPSGSGLGMTTDYLKPSAPFSDFFIPGLILFLMNGLLSIAVALLTFIRTRNYPAMIMLQGLILVGWIVIQLTMVNIFHVLHVVIGVIGLLLIFIGSRVR